MDPSSGLGVVGGVVAGEESAVSLGDDGVGDVHCCSILLYQWRRSGGGKGDGDGGEYSIVAGARAATMHTPALAVENNCVQLAVGGWQLHVDPCLTPTIVLSFHRNSRKPMASHDITIHLHLQPQLQLQPQFCNSAIIVRPYSLNLSSLVHIRST